ncbi:MAG: TolC family protein [Bacteroidia bacterium]|nr:TolC family protein [Bacteroidia bacterium]
MEQNTTRPTTKRTRRLWLALFFLAGSLTLPAQTQSFTLQQAIDYAMQNQSSVKTARFDEYIAKKQVNDYVGVGLPQLKANFSFNDNLLLRTTVIPASSFNPLAGPDDVLELKFGVQYTTDANASLTQLIFDGSFFVGLKAARIYAELAHKQVALTQTQTAATVSKAYYTALMSDVQMGILTTNINRLQQLYLNTKGLNEAGFVEKIDVDRLEINLKNLVAQQVRMERQAALAQDLLKFQMGMDPNETIILADSINIDAIVPITDNWADESEMYKKRQEFELLQTQRDLNLLNAKRIRMGNLPSVVAFGNLGTNWMSDKFDLFSARRWYPYAVVGLQASMPLFTGGRGNAQVAMAKLEAEKVSVSMEQFKNAVSMEIRQARTAVMNSRTSLEANKETLDLADNVYKVSQIKYQEGVGSNLEVLQAEQSLREAQTNYLTSLYEYFIAQIDLRKAQGELFTK